MAGAAASARTCTVKSTPDTPRKAGGSKAWSYAGLATVNPSPPPVPAENCEEQMRTRRTSYVHSTGHRMECQDIYSTICMALLPRF